MLEIKTVQDKKLQKEFCNQCGDEYDADSLAYSIHDSGNLIGIVQFAIKGDYGIIYTLSNSDDTEALITAIRTVFNFIDICGIKNVYFKPENHDDQIIKSFGFNKIKDVWQVNLDGFFDTMCEH